MLTQPFKSLVRLPTTITSSAPLVQGQSRHVHLLHFLFSNERERVAISSKLKHQPLPPAENLDLSLFDLDSDSFVRETLAGAIKRIRPFTFLSLVDPGVYRILPLAPFARSEDEIKKTRINFTRLGTYKEWHFHAGHKTEFIKNALHRAYEQLLHGARIQVHLSQFTAEKDVDWVLNNMAHLRPEAILAAMPVGTKMLVQPCFVPEESLKKMNVVWAMELPSALPKPTSEAVFNAARVISGDSQMRTEPTKKLRRIRRRRRSD